jgi:cargo-transport protein YPP1
LTLPKENDVMSSRDRAETLLDSVTKLAGWDSSEAWFWLGEVYEQCLMPVKAAECWSYCEELEERRPIREWRFVRPEWI